MAPPMSTDLVHGVIKQEFGRDVSELFVEFDDEPIAAASIGQVHRAIIVDPATGAERAVAVNEVMSAPPSESGSLHDTPTRPSPASAVTFSGSEGTVRL